MRRVLKLATITAFLGPAGCADAPITPDQIEANGKLRTFSREQVAFSAKDRATVEQAVSVSAVVAAQPQGAIEDRGEFAADVGTVHLHLRADQLMAPRPVVYRWTHEELTVLVPGTLAPSTSMSLASSFDIAPDLTGRWEVDVLTGPERPGDPPRVLVHREFVVAGP